MTAISIRFNDNQYRKINLASFEGESITSYMRNAVLEKIEDEEDYADAVQAMNEDNGKTYSAQEVKEMLGLNE